MGELKVNTAVVNEAVQTLKNAHYIMDIEADTLKEVAGIIETAWISGSTDILVSCINKVRKKVLKTSDYIEDSRVSLDSIAWKVKAVEAMNMASNIMTGGESKNE